MAHWEAQGEGRGSAAGVLMFIAIVQVHQDVLGGGELRFARLLLGGKKKAKSQDAFLEVNFGQYLADSGFFSLSNATTLKRFLR